MQASEFLVELQDILQREAPIAADTPLKDMEEWDSLAIMSCMAFLDRKFGVATSFSQYSRLHTVADLIALTGGAVR